MCGLLPLWGWVNIRRVRPFFRPPSTAYSGVCVLRFRFSSLFHCADPEPRIYSTNSESSTSAEKPWGCCVRDSRWKVTTFYIPLVR
ncbi:hypothetical protein QE152_g15827 [Popillia japonica]|uniref:Secreted protein n=1 Tax=Popillia japonica TaxID=7064 RepID=A0AAW1L4M9_POPJA